MGIDVISVPVTAQVAHPVGKLVGQGPAKIGPPEGVEMLTLRVDGQTLSHKAGATAAFQKFTWQGSGTHEAQLSVRFGNTDLGFASGEGLWAAFHLFQKANQSTPTGAGQLLEWITSSGKVSEPIKLPSGKPLTVRLDLDLDRKSTR